MQKCNAHNNNYITNHPTGTNHRGFESRLSLKY